METVIKEVALPIDLDKAMAGEKRIRLIIHTDTPEIFKEAEKIQADNARLIEENKKMREALEAIKTYPCPIEVRDIIKQTLNH